MSLRLGILPSPFPSKCAYLFSDTSSRTTWCLVGVYRRSTFKFAGGWWAKTGLINSWKSTWKLSEFSFIDQFRQFPLLSLVSANGFHVELESTVVACSKNPLHHSVKKFLTQIEDGGTRGMVWEWNRGSTMYLLCQKPWLRPSRNIITPRGRID